MFESQDILRRFAERKAGAQLSHVKTMRVEVPEWAGSVEIFGVTGAPEVLVFAWEVTPGPPAEYAAMVRDIPAESPAEAVRAWFDQEN